MPRPHFCRRVAGEPQISLFKPAGIPASELEEITLTLDEFEAIRLADLESMYQEKAADCMEISRQTFGRILESAHNKVAQALIQGKALRIEGGTVEVAGWRAFQCIACGQQWQADFASRQPIACPKCQKPGTQRWGRGYGRGGRRGRGANREGYGA